MAKIKILFLYTINPGVAYYRMVSFAQKMSELKIAHSRMFPDWDPKRLVSPDWEKHLNENMSQIEAQVKWADVIVFQYTNCPEGLSLVEAIRDLKPCFMEIDDYFKQVPHQSFAYDSNRPGDAIDLWATRQMVESTGVITTTQYLADNFKKYNQNIKIIPNCIDFDLWDGNGCRKRQDRSEGVIRIGWIGGATHGSDLKLIHDVIYKILNKYPLVEVCIVSYPPPDWPKHERLNLVKKWQTTDKYPKHLMNLNFDIGLAPLRDNSFNRGKSNLRYLEYCACHIPTVASRVEPFLIDFKGRLAWDDESWFQNLSELIENDDMRKKEGLNAYEDVKNKFNLEKISRQYVNHLKEYC